MHMAFTINNPEADRLAHELAAVTGESLTEAVTTALRERLVAVRKPKKRVPSMARIREIQAFVASLPDRDNRTLEEILYDEDGLPV